MLSDIHHIDIVRGPGSALYGPGAISMVINIVTYNAGTFQGTTVTSRMGAVEEFYSGEVKHGQKFDDNDGGVFAYAGIGKYVAQANMMRPRFSRLLFLRNRARIRGTQIGVRILRPFICRPMAPKRVNL